MTDVDRHNEGVHFLNTTMMSKITMTVINPRVTVAAQLHVLCGDRGVLGLL